MGNAKEIKTGIVLSYIQTGISIIVGFMFTPVMLSFLGKNEYGLYNTVSSTVAMLSILSLGFNSAYIRFFEERKNSNRPDAVSSLNGLFLCIFTVIGVVALFCGLFLTCNLDLVFRDGLTAAEFVTAKKLMLILAINLALSFPLSVFSDIITANERFIFIKSVGIINSTLNPFMGFILLFFGCKSVALAAINLTLQIITGAINIYYVMYKLQNRFTFKNFEKKIFNKIFKYTAFIALNMVIDQINWKIDNVLLGRFCGTSSVAVYSIGSTIHSLYMLFSTSVSSVFTPKIHQIAQKNKNSDLIQSEFTELFIKVGRIQFLILTLIATGFIVFGKSFINIWVGEEFANSYLVALILIIPVTVPLIQNLGIEIQRAINKHQFRAVVYTLMAVFNLIISVMLCRKYAEIGVAVGTSISIILANIIIMNIYYHKKCGINIIKFWRNIGRMSIGLIIPFTVAIIASRFIAFDTPLRLVAGIVSYTFIYCCSTWLLSMNEAEKNMVKSMLLKLRRTI